MEVDLTPQDDRPPLPDQGFDGVPQDGPPTFGDAEASEPVSTVPDVDESQVRTVLSMIGTGVHITFGHPAIDEHWRFTDPELDQLTPPITSYVNRSARLRAAVQRGDAISVALTLGLYTSRNLRISREIAEDEEASHDASPDDLLTPDRDAATPMQPFSEVP
jgi:hypothetical protein